VSAPRYIVAFTLLISVAFGGQSALLGTAEAQKATSHIKTTNKGKTAKARARAAKRTTSGTRKTASVKLRTGLGFKKPKPGESQETAKKPASAAARKNAAKPHHETTTAGGVDAPAGAATSTKKKLSKEERQEAKAKEKAKNSVLPERKTPIHQKLKDPNFFGEKDAIKGEPTLESVGGAQATLKRLQEPTSQFFSGDVGRLMAARLINRGSRNDADFRYAYGQEGFKNFAKADAILNRIPQGKLAKRFDVALLTEVNKVAFAEGGDSALVRVGKTLRDAFLPKAQSKAGQIRNYQSLHFDSKGLTVKEAENIQAHGATYVKLPFTRAGWIVYAKPNTVRPRLDSLIKTTKARLNDPAADPIETASDFVQKFIAIHPFADGNGRTARLMMDRILAEKGLMPPILKNTGNDIGLGAAEFAKEVLHGVARTNTMLGLSGSSKELGNKPLHSGAGYVQRMMKQHGHELTGEASGEFAKHEGLKYALGKDGFVYNSAGRPHLADKQGNLRPLGQMTLYILMRRVAQQKNAPKILEQITAPTRGAFAALKAGKPGKSGKALTVHSDLGAIKSDGSLSVDLEGIDGKMFISLLNPANVDTKTMLTKGNGGSELTRVMSRYQQADLELWYVKEAFSAKGDSASVAKIEKHRDVLFTRARSELRSRIKKGTADDDNPLGAKQEFERVQYQYSPLRYSKRADYTKKHGDSDAYIFRGENFAKWSGVHIDSAPFRPGLKDAAGMRAKKQGSLNLFDALDAVQRDTIGTGVQSYTTDLALLARKGGFADQHKGTKMNLAAMPKLGKALVNLRLKDGEVLEIKPNTGLFSALFTRKTITQPGHFSVEDIAPKELEALIKQHAPTEKAAELVKRAGQAQSTRKHLLSGLTSIFGSSRRHEVKVDDIMSEGQIKSFGTALSRARNLVTVHREGDTLNVTAHRRANVFKVKKTKMLPGTDSLAGSFIAEQEVHVMSTVMPHRILETFTQGHLAGDVGSVVANSNKPSAPSATAQASASGFTPPAAAAGAL